MGSYHNANVTPRGAIFPPENTILTQMPEIPLQRKDNTLEQNVILSPMLLFLKQTLSKL